MAEQDGESLSPTVTKVLDEFTGSLGKVAGIPDDTVKRLDTLLRKGKVPKADEISAAVFPASGDDAA